MQTVVKTASFTVTVADRDKLFLVDDSAGNVVVTMPSAVACGNDWHVSVAKTNFVSGTGTGITYFTTTIQPILSQTLNHKSNRVIRTRGVLETYISDGANFWFNPSVLDLPKHYDVFWGFTAPKVVPSNSTEGPAQVNAAAQTADQNQLVSDFVYLAQRRRIVSRTLLMPEIDDPPEIACQRFVGTYPDVISASAVPSGVVTGFVHFNGATNTGRISGRGGELYGRTTEAGVDGVKSGGALILTSTPNGTQSPQDRLIVDHTGRINVGASSTSGSALYDGRLNVQHAENIPTYFARAEHASYTSYIQRLQSGRAASAAFDFIRCESANGADREFRVLGDGAIYSDAGTTVSTPADFAEMIREWWDANPLGEDRAGMSVVLARSDDPDIVVMPDEDGDHDDSYIRLFSSLPKDTPPTAIVGIVSVNGAVKGGAAWNRWSKKYRRDPFGRPLTEEIETVSWIVERVEEISPERTYFDEETQEERIKPRKTKMHEDRHSYDIDRMPAGIEVPTNAERGAAKRPVLNPDFDPEKPYAGREERPEWDFVGLRGRLALRNGEARHPRWFRLGKITPEVSEWLV